MNKYRRLLCPVDFSDISKNAFQIAIDLAVLFKADLHVMHVFQMPASAIPEGIYDIPDDMEDKVKSHFSKKLDEFIKNHPTPEINITTGSYAGFPHVEIIKYANEANADMIVMGTHGRTGLSHVLLGSVTERVIRTSDIPVLTVRK
ncbi:MAG: universal stress protein [Gammaproteobacteria bacterium]|nr:universal stress protein [Gammaproteobacteria bacterium]